MKDNENQFVAGAEVTLIMGELCHSTTAYIVDITSICRQFACSFDYNQFLTFYTGIDSLHFCFCRQCLVDEAVLSLSDYRIKDLVSQFYPPNNRIIQTVSSRKNLRIFRHDRADESDNRRK